MDERQFNYYKMVLCTIYNNWYCDKYHKYNDIYKAKNEVFEYRKLPFGFIYCRSGNNIFSGKLHYSVGFFQNKGILVKLDELDELDQVTHTWIRIHLQFPTSREDTLV